MIRCGKDGFRFSRLGINQPRKVCDTACQGPNVCVGCLQWRRQLYATGISRAKRIETPVKSRCKSCRGPTLVRSGNPTKADASRAVIALGAHPVAQDLEPNRRLSSIHLLRN